MSRRTVLRNAGKSPEPEFGLGPDPLTGLLNRRAFLSALQQEREKTMLLIDLDHFKQVNDTYGHATGDRILIDFARRVADMLPAPRHLARWGGEEFAVLLPRVRPDDAREQAERIRLLV